MKYKVYAIQGMEFNTIEVEAESEEEAIEIYNSKWNNGIEVYSVDYRDDDVRYVVEKVEEKLICPKCRVTDIRHANVVIVQKPLKDYKTFEELLKEIKICFECFMKER